MKIAAVQIVRLTKSALKNNTKIVIIVYIVRTIFVKVNQGT